MAAGLVAELSESLNIQADLIEGDKGIFDVKADGKLVFSKFKSGRFPHLGEISAVLINEENGGG
jgi:hypothetical protein